MALKYVPPTKSTDFGMATAMGIPVWYDAGMGRIVGMPEGGFDLYDPIAMGFGSDVPAQNIRMNPDGTLSVSTGTNSGQTFTFKINADNSLTPVGSPTSWNENDPLMNFMGTAIPLAATAVLGGGAYGAMTGSTPNWLQSLTGGAAGPVGSASTGGMEVADAVYQGANTLPSTLAPGAVDPVAAAAAGLGAEGLGVAPANPSLLPAGVAPAASSLPASIAQYGSTTYPTSSVTTPDVLRAAGVAGGAASSGILDTIASELGLSKSSLVGLLGNAGSALIGYNATQNAAQAQLDAIREANALQKYMYDTTRSDFAPWRETGTWALGKAKNLLENPSQITSDPGYQFGLSEGNRLLQGSAAAKGGLYSGAAMKAMDRYGADYAMTKLNDAMNRYNTLSGSGQTATQSTASAGQNYANQAGNNITNAGNARASSYMGGANILSGALNNWLGSYQQENMLKRLFPDLYDTGP